MKQPPILSLLLALSILTGCAAAGASTPIQPVSPPSPAPSLAPVGQAVCFSEGLGDAYNDYALRLFRSSRSEGKNTLLSPLSLTLALGMTANGAQGDTLEAFEGLFGMSRDTLNSLCLRFLSDYSQLEGSTRSTLVNSLWADPDIALLDEFVLRCTDTYNAQLFHMDLQDPATVDLVNQWAREMTNGLIPSVVDEFDPDAVLALINAVYLKNAFARPFEEPHSDWEMDFTTADGTISHPKGMCNGTRQESYIEADNGRGVVLPYDDGRLGLLLMLPEEGLSLTDYLAGWNGSTIPDLLSAQRDTKVRLTMPKFKVEWSASLASTLSALGLEAAFDPDRADFSPMGTFEDPNTTLYIGDVIHKTAFEVNEKGTEAAAVTAVIMEKATAVMPIDEPVLLTLDRPFVYAIIDLELDTPLFLGTLENCN
ncbi:MAG: serine protease [Oscillospiraceae bacterium]|nr:serine protease [Oscillospiraceae bacterium]